MSSHSHGPVVAALRRGADAPVIAAEPGLYKQGMRRLAAGVTVIATEYQGERSGLVSTSVTSVSADPPVLLACISKSASSHDPVALSGRFCVNVLQQGDEELAGRFSSSKHRESRFLGREWTVLATGAPALVGCLASFDCVVARSLYAETHTVFFGNVVSVRLWSESIDSNLASADAARRLIDRTRPGAASFDALHALDYLEYAYLQIGDEPKARQVRDEAATAKTFDDPNFAAGYALAAVPARFALEHRRWDEAAKLEASDASLPWERFRYARAITHFAQALGSARSNEPERARVALANLEGIHAVLVKSPIPGPYDWAGQVDSMRLAAAAWLAYSERRRDEAVDLARTAADIEDRVGKHPVTPGAVLPARELLADLLREIGRPGEALGQYKASLRVAPNRLNSLYGAARSAETSGASRDAAQFYTQLLDNCGSSHRAEVEHARNFLKRHRELSTGMPGGAAPATGNRTTDPHE